MSDDFSAAVRGVLDAPLRCNDIQVLQVNVGFRCNQHCAHCHHRAGPDRAEQMGAETVDQVLRALRWLGRPTLDITGGAPELNSHLRRLVRGATRARCPVMVRTNLTALLEPNVAGTAEFLARRRATIVASLPCYLPQNVASQRGAEAYDRSIAALQLLNELGYGIDPQLELDVVYNPIGAYLPPAQDGLEKDYKEQLARKFGIVFSNLFVITNMPIGRFAGRLGEEGALEDYERLLTDQFNPDTVEGLMCCRQVNVGPDGKLYDCDFNLALGIPVAQGWCGHVRDLTRDNTIGRPIATGAHCFGCTAGAGSSCTGALAKEQPTGAPH